MGMHQLVKNNNPRHLQVLENNRENFLRGRVDTGSRTGGICVGVHAPWSQGKTLLLVFFCVRRNEDEGIPVVANFRIRHVAPFSFLDDIEMVKDMRGGILALDEIRRLMDSYMSRGQKARFISNLTADLGKQSCDLYYSDQHYNAAPSRVKANLNLIAEPSYDDESQWVTVYLYKSIEDYIMKMPFFYFGFYGPNYWKYYETKFKIEDYKFKFKVDRHAKDFEDWLIIQDIQIKPKKGKKGESLISKQLVNLWNQSEGQELTASEQSAILTYVKLKEGGIIG